MFGQGLDGRGEFEGDARAYMKDLTEYTEKTSAKLDAASTPKDAGEIMVAYAEEMKSFVERGQALKKKYPDKKTDSDPALQAEQEQLRKAMEAFSGAMMKVMIKWPGAPEIMDATKKMMEIGQSIKE